MLADCKNWLCSYVICKKCSFIQMFKNTEEHLLQETLNVNNEHSMGYISLAGESDSDVTQSLNNTVSLRACSFVTKANTYLILHSLLWDCESLT